MLSQNQNSKPGISIILIIVIIAGILALAAGGYFLYDKMSPKPLFVPPAPQPHQLIPSDLAAIAVGANATSFVILNNDDSMAPLIALLPAAPYLQDLGDLKSILVVIPSKDSNSLKVYLDFGSEKTALHFKDTLLQTYKPSLPEGSVLANQSNILIYSGNAAGNALSGKFTDNPNLKKISDYTDSQLIAYFNYNENVDLYYGLQSFINTIGASLPRQVDNALQALIPKAHAQSSGGNGFLQATDNPNLIPEPSPFETSLNAFSAAANFAKESVIAVKVDPQNISVQINTTLLDKSEIANSAILQAMNGIHPDIPTTSAQLETVYADALSKFNNSLPTLQDKLSQALADVPGTNGKLTLNNLNLDFSIQAPTDNLKKMLQLNQAAQKDAPARARDAERKANVNNIIAAIEVYNADHSAYPPTSDCLENLGNYLSTYFKGGVLPTDHNGPQQIGTHNCQSGFYYQYAPSGNYAVWSKVELPSSGNTDLTPSDWPKNFSQFSTTSGAGQYYVVSMLDTGTLTSTAESAVGNRPRPKVKTPQFIQPNTAPSN